MKIGLFGGTFDPIHVGHLILAEQVREVFELNKVIFIPSSSPPHKNAKDITPASLRLKMVELAIQGNDFFEISTIELDRSNPSYSIDTVKEFRKKHSIDSLFFIVGTDSLFEMHAWYKVDELVKLCQFIYVYRPGFSIQGKSGKDLRLDVETFNDLTRHSVKIAPMGVSSTEIRMRIAERRSIRYLVPNGVLKFIENEGLYKS